MERNSLDEAVAPLERAIEIRPNSTTARWHLATTLRLGNRLNDAITLLEQAITIDPNYFEALGELGTYLQAQGDHQGAMQYFKRAIDLNSDNAPMYFYMAYSLQALGKPGEAVDQLRVAKRLAPSHANIHFQLGVLLAKRGNMDDALENLRDASRLKSDWLPLLLVMTGLLATHPDVQVRDGPEAVLVGERAAQLSGYQNAEALDWLAAAYAAADRFDEAVETAEQALKLAATEGEERLMEQLVRRLELYRNQKPFLDTKWNSNNQP